MGFHLLRRNRFFDLSFLGYLFVISVIVWQCYLRPSYNWDTLPYMAIILNMDDDDQGKIHQRVLEIAKFEIPVELYQRMIDTTHEIRKGLIQSSNQFFQFTSFFRTKPLYVLCSYLSYKAGFLLTKAPAIPSLLSYAGISILIYFWLSRSYKAWLATLLSISIMLAPPVLEGARLATPDMMSSMVLLYGFYLFLYGAKWGWIAMIMSIAILIRLDNLIIAFVWLLFQVAILRQGPDEMRSRLTAFALILASWILYAVVLIQYVNFQDGFGNFYGGLENRIYPWVLVTGAVSGLKTLQTSHLTVVLVICAMVLFYGKKIRFRDAGLQQYLFVILITALVMKYLFFPDLTTRLHLPVYITCIMLTLEEVRNYIRTGVSSLTK